LVNHLHGDDTRRETLLESPRNTLAQLDLAPLPRCDFKAMEGDRPGDGSPGDATRRRETVARDQVEGVARGIGETA